jgi:pyruvate dehydrogenase E2 component (dihydrolipoamide acetyltransferase)
MIKEIRIPEISENVTSGTVVGVLVKVGDKVGVDDPIIEFETDKAVVEIPAQLAGKIVEILVEEGDSKNVGDVIAKVETDAEAADDHEKPPEQVEDTRAQPQAQEAKSMRMAVDAKKAADEAPSAEKEEQESAGVVRDIEERQKAQEPKNAEAQFVGKQEGSDRPTREPVPAGPASRRLARELGVDIAAVVGTGPGDRITEADVKAHVKKAMGRQRAPEPAFEAPPLPDFSRWGEVDIQQISTVRRITAQGTTTSWHQIPHVTQFDEADITTLSAFLETNTRPVEKAGGKLTITAVLMKVCALALKRFAPFNASLDMAGKKLIFKRYIHIGLMVDTPRGLLVPVVRNADTKSITRLAVEIKDLAERARNKKIKPDEMEGATFSISNQGGIGGSGFTPVILWPQAAILGVSRSAILPRYQDKSFVPRTILPLSLSYDHRIVDGADAARFMRFVCESLEQPFTLHL